MPNCQAQLPLEILGQVFHLIPHNDLLACLYVCHAWFVSAKPVFYKELQFSQFSSINRFITCMQFSPDHCNLLVQRITFTFYLRGYGYLPTFRNHFRHLAVLCPYVETLASTRQLEDLVVKALYSLPSPLKKLSAFPYSAEVEYNDCALLYSHALKEYIMDNVGNSSSRIGFERLSSFPNLRKLSLMETPLRTLRDVEFILSMCPTLEVLSVELHYHADDEDYEDLVPQLPLQLQYPKVKSLAIHCPQKDIDTKVYYPFLHKCNNLERLKLVAINVEISENPPYELETFFDLLHALTHVTLMFKGDYSNRTRDSALDYLRFLLHPQSIYVSTFLSIESNGYTYGRGDHYLHYTTNLNKRRELDIALPDFETNDTNLHSAYVKAFAPYVNKLELDYEITNVYTNAGESFLYAVLSQCTALNSLTVLHGTFSQALPSTINTTLRSLFLASCHITSTFIESVSLTCANLRQLTLRNIAYSDTNPIIMSQTELRLLELNLGQFIAPTPVLIIIRDCKWEWLFYTNFEKKLYMVSGERETPEGCQVVLFEFKSIRQLRVYNLYGCKDMTLELL